MVILDDCSVKENVFKASISRWNFQFLCVHVIKANMLLKGHRWLSAVNINIPCHSHIGISPDQSIVAIAKWELAFSHIIIQTSALCRTNSNVTVRAGFRPVGAPGQTKLWGPQYMIFMEAIKLSSEASEPLGMRGPEKRPLELQLFFVSLWVSLFKQC